MVLCNLVFSYQYACTLSATGRGRAKAKVVCRGERVLKVSTPLPPKGNFNRTLLAKSTRCFLRLCLPGQKTTCSVIMVLSWQRLIFMSLIPNIFVLARLQNYNATDDGNVDFRSFKKNFTFKAWKVNIK